MLLLVILNIFFIFIKKTLALQGVSVIFISTFLRDFLLTLVAFNAKKLMGYDLQLASTLFDSKSASEIALRHE